MIVSRKITVAANSETRESGLPTATVNIEKESSLSSLVRYLTPVEIAASLRVDVKTVLRWLRDQNHPLRGVKVNNMWRVDPDDFAAFINGDKNDRT